MPVGLPRVSVVAAAKAFLAVGLGGGDMPALGMSAADKGVRFSTVPPCGTTLGDRIIRRRQEAVSVRRESLLTSPVHSRKMFRPFFNFDITLAVWRSSSFSRLMVLW